MARKKSGLIHIKNRVVHKISIDKATGKYYIRGTDIEVPGNKLCQPNQNPQRINRRGGYDYSKPYQAQGLGDEWDDYAWSADDF